MATSNSEWVQYKANILARLDFAKVFAVIKDQRPSGEGCVQGRCPFHDDHDPSFGVDLTTGAWQCFTGCGSGGAIEFHMRRTNQKFKEALLDLGDSLGLERPTCSTRDGGDVVYPYQDEHGTLLYEVVRKPGKRWTQRRPDGKGGWVWNLKGVERVLYNLPDLNARRGETVYVVEGEKDADRLKSLGLLATTNSGGAGKWRPSYSEVLKGRTVVILPDNDKPGLDHAEMVAKSLGGNASSVRVVPLPGLGPKQDVSDWLDSGGDREQLEALVAATPKYEPGSLEMAPDPHARPVIETHDRPFREILDEAQAAVLAANDPPQVFNSAGYLARLRDFGQGPQIDLLEERTATGLLARAADWVATRGASSVHVKPPKEAAADIIVNPPPGIPRLDAVITTPVFDHDWRLLTAAGYHPESRLWLHVEPGTVWPEIPMRPTPEDVQIALSLILDELLVDFPFTSASDRTHAVAALLLPFARRMFCGPTPIHLIEASTPGSGKSLLAEMIAFIALGHSAGSTTLTTNEEEARKKLTAILSRGAAVITIDNIQGGLWSAQVASAITAEVWEDRMLGKTQMVTFPNRALWLVSGNNPKLSMEIARRCIRIRLDAGDEQPWKRKGFKHDPLRDWVRQDRIRLVHAVLTLIRHWIASGCPHSSQTLGSFESWSRALGGMVEHLGLHGFLADMDEFYEAADSETGEWKGLVTAWWVRYRETPVGVRELIELAEANDLVAFACVGQSDQARRSTFGKALARLRGRRFGDLDVVVSRDGHAKKAQYRLRQIEQVLFPIRENLK